MMATPINVDSNNIIKLIGKGSRGVEIGVWKGSTTKKFLERNLEKLILIDPWSVDPYKERGEEKFNEYIKRYSELVEGKTEEKFQSYYDEVYREVIQMFGRVPCVNIFRATSSQWFEEQWNGELFDWVYIDGDHSYEGAMYDLKMSQKIVRKGGLIIGDDYKWRSPGGKPGVKKAVDEFSKNTGMNPKQHGKHQFVMVNE
jgi:hypothetical protein